MNAKLVKFVVLKQNDMKRILIIMAALTFAVASCGPRGGKGASEAEQADSTATVQTMENKQIEEPMFDIYTSKGKNSSHVHYACFISAIAEHGCNRRGEGNHQGEESRADAEDRNERARVDLLRIDAFLICEAETSGLETKHENYLKDSDIRHELRNDTIAFRSQKPCVDRNEKEVYYAGQNSAETINDGLSGQLF